MILCKSFLTKTLETTNNESKNKKLKKLLTRNYVSDKINESLEGDKQIGL